MKNRIVICILAGAMVFSLAGCQKKNKDVKEPTQVEETTEEAEAPEEEAEVTEEEASETQTDTTEVTDEGVEGGTTEAEYEEVANTSDAIVDYTLKNPSGGEDIVVKVWEGEGLTFSGSELNEEVSSCSSYANNISITHEVKKDDGTSTKDALIQDLKNFVRDRMDSDSTGIKTAKDDGEKAWARIQYGDDSVNVCEYVIFTKQSGCLVKSNIIYYLSEDEHMKEYITDREHEQMCIDTFGVEETNENNIDLPEDITNPKYELVKIEIPGKRGEVFGNAYSWNANQIFDVDYSTWTDEDYENAETDEDETYINSFTSGVKGSYITYTGYALKNKKKFNAKAVVDEYVETLGYYMDAGSKVSDVEGNAKRASITMKYPVGDYIYTQIYDVKKIKSGYRILQLVKTSDEGKEYFDKMLETYEVKVQECKNEIEPITMDDPENYDFEEEEETEPGEPLDEADVDDAEGAVAEENIPPETEEVTEETAEQKVENATE